MSYIRVLQSEDEGLIRDHEANVIQSLGLDEVELQFKSWHAPWREESLKHYLPLGWSFGLWKNDVFKGYFLAQPLLFARGFTQSLWVEHLSATDDEARSELLETAYKLAREKHFQKLLVNKSEGLKEGATSLSFKELDGEILEINTAKL